MMAAFQDLPQSFRDERTELEQAGIEDWNRLRGLSDAELSRLARSGRMAGAQTPWNASMQRSFREANPTAPSFKKCVGPLQSAALEGNQPVLGGLTVMANGQIFTPHDSQLIDQLNAGDTITGVNGVPFEHVPSGGIFASSNLFRADRYKPWLAKVEAAGNALPRIRNRAVPATGPEFFRRWKLLDGKELQQIFKLPATPLADKKVEEILCAGLHFALLKGLPKHDSRPPLPFPKGKGMRHLMKMMMHCHTSND